jgi:LacI family transcriptional regulator
MSVSLKDIAQSLHLSKTTVSWILSGKGKERRISQATIDLVMAFAQQVNYRPNLLARSLSVGFTDTIGLIIPAIGDTFYAQLAHSIEKEARQFNYMLTICSSEGDGETENNLIEALKSKRVDGLIIVPTKKSSTGISRLMQEQFPFVLVDRYFPDLKTNFIIVDNEQSSSKLVQHLISKGSTRVAVLTTDVHLRVMQNRLKGYYHALGESCIAGDHRLLKVVSRVDYVKDSVRVLDELFAQVPDVDGFYFTTHYLAMEALRYFIVRNIDFAGRFNLACFHHTVALDVMAPGMSYAKMPVDIMGARAVQILSQSIRVKSTEPSGVTLENGLELHA